jgi:hypothetical protein
MNLVLRNEMTTWTLIGVIVRDDCVACHMDAQGLLIMDKFHTRYLLSGCQGAKVLGKELMINTVPDRVFPTKATLHVLSQVIAIYMIPQHRIKMTHNPETVDGDANP